MAVVHAGNAINQMTFEEHDGVNNAKRVNVVAGGVGQATITPVGLVTLAPSPNFIGLVTVVPGANVTLNASAAFIGIVTIANQPPLVDGVGKIGFVTIGGIGTVTLADPKGYIGLVTVGGIGTITLADPKGFIGLTTTTLGASPAFVGIVTITNQPPLVASAAFVGIVTVAGIGTVTLSDPKGFIGLTTSVNGAGDRFIGLVTNVQAGLTTLAPGPNFIGLVSVQGTVALLGNTTVLARNAGTNKTIKSLPITISTGSAATVYVPSNTFYITNILLNSNATVRLNIRSGATYLTGNASLGINLNPGGGFVNPGAVDAPLYVGLAAAAPIVIEKTDYSGVISQIGGSVTFFDE